jgi:hypothetical protein
LERIEEGGKEGRAEREGEGGERRTPRSTTEVATRILIQPERGE